MYELSCVLQYLLQHNAIHLQIFGGLYQGRS
jgi:hypothetical protein